MTVEYDPIKNVMVVKWAKTSDATEYSVHRSLNGGNGVWYKTVSGLSLEDADISVKQTYGYAAKAQRGNDRGARSAFVTYGYADGGIDNAAAPAATPEPPRLPSKAPPRRMRLPSIVRRRRRHTTPAAREKVHNAVKVGCSLSISDGCIQFFCPHQPQKLEDIWAK